MYDTFCKGNPGSYLLMLALLPTCVSLLLMLLVRIYETSLDDDKKHLNGFCAIAIAIATYLMAIIILNNIFTFPFWARITTFMLLLVLLASPIGIAIKAQSEDLKRVSESVPAEDNQYSLLQNSDTEIISFPVTAREDCLEYDDKQDMNLLLAMRTIDFWLLFVAMVCGMGSGLATINNMSQLGQSLGYTTAEIDTFVSLWSIWNFLGRFGAGYVSDYLLHTRGLERPLLMVITLATMTIGHVIVASGFSGNLYVGSILVGICYGSQWSLMPTITSEIFGVRHMGTIFNTIAIASPVGSYIFSVRIIGYIYDKEASGEDNSCSGTHCFMLSFFIMASVACFGFLVAIALFFRTRRFYQTVVFPRLKHSLR